MRSLRQASEAAAPKARTVDRPVKIPTDHHYRSFHSKTIDPGMVTATELHIFPFSSKSPTCMCFTLLLKFPWYNNVQDYKVKQRLAWVKDSACFKVKQIGTVTTPEMMQLSCHWLQQHFDILVVHIIPARDPCHIFVGSLQSPFPMV